MIKKSLHTLSLALLITPGLAKTFTYQNPITQGLAPAGVRDCHVFRDGNKWYMTNTAWPHWKREEKFGLTNPGVVLYSSDDLLNWKFEKTLVRPNFDRWYAERFWAPEIQRIGGKYYATFNCTHPDRVFVGQHTGYAVADQLTGPYKVVTAEKPLGNGNDLHFFEDTDGKVYAFWNRGREFGIGFAQIDLATGKLLTEPNSAIRPAGVTFAKNPDGTIQKEPGYDGRPIDKVAKYDAWDSIGIEGAYVIKRGDTYYLFYSSWTRGYEIGYATARAVTGPWTKHADNPIYGAQNKSTCEKNGFTYEGNPANPFNQVGHNEIFTGPDGRLWLSCHGIIDGKPPMLVIDPLDFDAHGNIIKREPTYTPQSITLP